jgi:hypothetical protein
MWPQPAAPFWRIPAVLSNSETARTGEPGSGSGNQEREVLREPTVWLLAVLTPENSPSQERLPVVQMQRPDMGHCGNGGDPAFVWPPLA